MRTMVTQATVARVGSENEISLLSYSYPNLHHPKAYRIHRLVLVVGSFPYVDLDLCNYPSAFTSCARH